MVVSCLSTFACLVNAANAERGLTVEKAKLAEMASEKRLALVIGNAGYRGLSPLANPGNDARGIAGALRTVGFEVVELLDADEDTMERAIVDFGLKLEQGGIGLFYYAGHGVQVDGRNYMIPLRARIKRREYIKSQAVDVGDVLQAMAAAGNRLNIVVLDACRNNPFPGDFRDLHRGLAQVTAPRGTFIGYATGPGELAEDGTGSHSIFTGALIQALKRSGVPLETVFKEVRARVLTATENRQVPWTASSVTGDFYFRLPEAGPSPGTRPATKPQIAELDREMYVVGAGAANVRAGPGTEHGKVGKLKAGAAVEVTGKVRDKDWYRVALADGQQGFVWDRLLSERKPPAEPEAASPKTDTKVAVGVYPKRRRAGDTFKDCDDCPEMVVIPRGTFKMGSPPAEREWFIKQGAKQEWADYEIPRHSVNISHEVAVGKFEVTRGQYGKFAADTGRGGGDGCYTWADGKWTKEASRNWRSPGFEQTDSHPVTCISWDDAKAYVDWLSKETGEPYRLLSEAEWEYVARAGTSSMRYWGHDWDNKDGCAFANVANKEDNWTRAFNCSDGHKYTAPIGKYRPNAFGLHDMLGNLWEWTEDCWNTSNTGSPADGSARLSGNCNARVLRGGSWNIYPGYLRAALRFRSDIGSRSSFVGFRVARTLSR